MPARHRVFESMFTKSKPDESGPVQKVIGVMRTGATSWPITDFTRAGAILGFNTRGDEVKPDG